MIACAVLIAFVALSLECEGVALVVLGLAFSGCSLRVILKGVSLGARDPGADATGPICAGSYFLAAIPERISKNST